MEVMHTVYTKTGLGLNKSQTQYADMRHSFPYTHFQIFVHKFSVHLHTVYASPQKLVWPLADTYLYTVICGWYTLFRPIERKGRKHHIIMSSAAWYNLPPLYLLSWVYWPPKLQGQAYFLQDMLVLHCFLIHQSSQVLYSMPYLLPSGTEWSVGSSNWERQGLSIGQHLAGHIEVRATAKWKKNNGNLYSQASAIDYINQSSVKINGNRYQSIDWHWLTFGNQWPIDNHKSRDSSFIDCHRLPKYINIRIDVNRFAIDRYWKSIKIYNHKLSPHRLPSIFNTNCLIDID